MKLVAMRGKTDMRSCNHLGRRNYRIKKLVQYVAKLGLKNTCMGVRTFCRQKDCQRLFGKKGPLQK
jgi:hypothetical protein